MLNIVLGVSLLVASLAGAEDPPVFERDIRPLMEKHCFDCHDDSLQKGDLNIARFDTQAMVVESVAVWQRMGMRIQNGEMPPGKRPRPTEEEKALIAKWLESLNVSKEDCNHLATEESVSWYPGYVMSRRLNRFEYENTIRDLLGLGTEVAEIFPADGAGGEGFDNTGNALFLSAIQVEKYLEAADESVDPILPSENRNPLAVFGRFLGRALTFRWSPTEAEAARRELLTSRSHPGHDSREAAEIVLHDFAERAWRRPVTPEEVDRLLEAYDLARDEGKRHKTALNFAFKAVLVSPNFLFLAEPEPEAPGVYALGDYPLASRLSYFLWSTMPDEELFALAREGRLQEDEVLTAQVHRMLRDPKAKALGDLFASQWLGITQLGETTKPDEDRFPEFDVALSDAMHEEVALFFQHIVAEDRSLLELIDADYTFANERLAAIYGIDAVAGEEMQRVQLADARRGGVLGMAAVLTATSHPLRTSPVLRGKWVLEQLLGDTVPPPPPNVEQLPEDDVQPDGLTLRQRLEAHRANPDCAGCHARMDPIGFGLENFDPIGRWRDEQAEQPVDAMGELPSGETFNGPEELKAILLQRKDAFAKNLTRKMLGYALGRSLTRYDNCVIDDCVEAMQANEYQASQLFTGIVLSYPFRHRYSGGHSEGDSE